MDNEAAGTVRQRPAATDGYLGSQGSELIGECGIGGVDGRAGTAVVGEAARTPMASLAEGVGDQPYREVDVRTLLLAVDHFDRSWATGGQRGQGG